MAEVRGGRKRQEEIWESDGYAHYLNSRVYAFVKTYQIVHFEYVEFIVSKVYLNHSATSSTQVYLNKTAEVNGE